MTNTDITTHQPGARVVPRAYREPRGRGARFFTVECLDCLAVLNSGHHYRANEQDHAQKLADDHNREEHPTMSITTAEAIRQGLLVVDECGLTVKSAPIGFSVHKGDGRNLGVVAVGNAVTLTYHTSDGPSRSHRCFGAADGRKLLDAITAWATADERAAVIADAASKREAARTARAADRDGVVGD